MDNSFVTTFMLAETLFDDKTEERRDIRDLMLPLLLCGSMGTAQPTQVGAAAGEGPWASQPTVVVENNNTLQTLLLLSLLRGRRREKPVYDKPA